MSKIIFTAMGIIAILLLGFLAFVSWFAYGYARDSNPGNPTTVPTTVSQGINFGTTRVDNLLQWDTIRNRIDVFFDTYPAYKVPDSLQIRERVCNGCAEFQKVIFFQSEPKEIYKVNFGRLTNSIDIVYQLEGGGYRERSTHHLESEEKARMELRLKKNVLDKIDWNVEEIHFSNIKK